MALHPPMCYACHEQATSLTEKPMPATPGWTPRLEKAVADIVHLFPPILRAKVDGALRGLIDAILEAVRA